MEQLFKILLYLHIAGGATSLIVGSIVLSLKKGDARHKLLGNIFFYSMLLAALVALPMSYLHTNLFLFIIGIFTTYMLLTGVRYLAKKSAPATLIDHLLTVLMLVFGLAFMYLGIVNIINGNSFGTVFLVFGLISLLFVYQDRKNFTGQARFKNYWLTTHLTRMIGAYIASATAFIVVNNTILPNIVAWLLPTVILTPLIVKWIRQYKVDKTV
jgi:uncharacterized membrane protein